MNTTTDARKTEDTDARLLLLSPLDNVFVLRGAIKAGENILVRGVQVSFKERIGLGHKLARTMILSGSKVLKYGARSGRPLEIYLLVNTFIFQTWKATIRRHIRLRAPKRCLQKKWKDVTYDYKGVSAL